MAREERDEHGEGAKALVDPARLRRSLEQVGEHGDSVPLYFYATLFVGSPELRELFPVSMSAQREKLLAALMRVVSQADRLDELAPFLRQLGVDHRRFEVRAEHYPAVGAALLATLEHFSGPEWTPELAKEWAGAYELVASTMLGAADDAAARQAPAWYDAEVVAHERRTLDVAVIRVRPEPWLTYRPGQSVAVETHLRPRQWRWLSPANAPRQDGTVDFHVRLVGGGPVSAAFVQSLSTGDVLRVGAPVGDRLVLGPARDLVMLAGGTGLAPLKALVEQVAAEGGQRRVHLVVGARTVADLYDRDDLDRLADAHRHWLRVTFAISAGWFRDTAPGLEQGTAVDVAVRHGAAAAEEIFVCGSPEMVRGSLRTLGEAGVPAERVRTEEFASPDGGGR